MRIVLFLSVVILFFLGLVMVFNTTSAQVLDQSLHTHTHFALLKQFIFFVLGLLLSWGVIRIKEQVILRMAPFLFYSGLFLLLLVLIPHVGIASGGARRWLGVGLFTFQPSELIKPLVLLFFIERYLLKGKKTPKEFFQALIPIFIAIFLVMREPDNGTAFVIAVSLMPLFFLTSLKMRYWFTPLVVIFFLGAIVAYQLPYVRARIEVFLDPVKDIQGKGHQPYQAKIAIGSGRLLGRGPGKSMQKFTFLPEAQNDYIAAIFAEEFGFVGMLGLVLLYMSLALSGFFLALKAKYIEGLYLAASITFLLVFQAFLNLAIVSGLLPSKGVNLPFFSQGGSSLIVNMVCISLLLTIPLKKKEERGVV